MLFWICIIEAFLFLFVFGIAYVIHLKSVIKKINIIRDSSRRIGMYKYIVLWLISDKNMLIEGKTLLFIGDDYVNKLLKKCFAKNRINENVILEFGSLKGVLKPMHKYDEVIVTEVANFLQVQKYLVSYNVAPEKIHSLRDVLYYTVNE